MTTNKVAKFSVIGLATTITVASLGLSFDNESSFEPDYNYFLNRQQCTQDISSFINSTNTDAIIGDFDIESLNNFNIISEFVAKLVDNSEMIEPEFVEAINKGYWDLI